MTIRQRISREFAAGKGPGGNQRSADATAVLAQVAYARDKLLPSAVSHSETQLDSPWKRFLKKRAIQSEYALPGVY